VSDKPEVHYVDLAGEVVPGELAFVYLREHHSAKIPAPGEWIRTTRVQLVRARGAGGPVFETRNTVYKPYLTDEQLDFESHKQVAA
jgi:hypothetical protein